MSHLEGPALLSYLAGAVLMTVGVVVPLSIMALRSKRDLLQQFWRREP